MGLRCLLGHDFNEPELQREREEDGNEVVTTVSEVKTCARCGETQIVSENTEVTTMEQLTDEAAGAEAANTGGAAAQHGTPEKGATPEERDVDVGPDESEPFGAAMDPTPDDVDEATGTSAAAAGGDSDDAVIIDDDPGEQVDASKQPTATAGEDGDDGATLLDEGVPEASTDTALGGDHEEYPDVESGEGQTDGQRDDERNAETDDGVILDETSEPDGDRERGAWPEVEDDETPGTDPAPWPEQEGDDEGYSAEAGAGNGSDDVEFGGGLTPEAAGDAAADEDAEYVEAPDGDTPADTGVIETETGGGEESDVDVGITRGESPDLGPSTASVTMEYYCPECEMTRDADGNSMRAGDICPECKRGYVTERPVRD